MAKIEILKSPDILKGKKFNKAIITLSNGMQVIGSLQSGIEISYAPEYNSMADIINLPAVNTMEKAVTASTGAQLFDGILSQKQYSGASHINITIALKVLDEEGTGKVLLYAKALASQCQPIPLSTADITAAAAEKAAAVGKLGMELLAEGGKFAWNTVKAGGLTYEQSTKVTDGVVDGALAVSDAVTGGNIGSSVDGLIDDVSKNLAKQRQVKLEISDYLKFNNMVITSVSQSFSYEQSVAGPLYADFSIGFSTLKVPDSGKVLTYYKDPKDPNNPRVKIT
jgi:hypothetical protein